MRKVILVGVGFMGRPYVRAAREAGYAVNVVESSDWPAADFGPGVELTPSPGLGPTTWAIDEMWAAGGYAASVASSFDGVLAFSEPHVLTAALIADQHNLLGPSLHAALLSRNKALQRACFAAHSLPQPDFSVVGDLDDTLAWANSRFPVVLKPLALFGSVGVELVADSQALRSRLKDRENERLIVEVAIEGPEFSWEGFVRDGVIQFGTVTAKETTGPPWFVEVAHRAGHDLGPEAPATREMFERVVRSAGIRTGLVHLEFRMTTTGPAITEVAVRTPGDFILDLVADCYGFDPYHSAVALAMGDDPRLPDQHARPESFAAVWFPVCAPGTVVDIAGVEELRAHRAVKKVAVSVEVGDVVSPLHSSAQRVGYVLVKAASPEDREDAIAAAQEMFTITTR